MNYDYVSFSIDGYLSFLIFFYLFWMFIQDSSFWFQVINKGKNRTKAYLDVLKH